MNKATPFVVALGIAMMAMPTAFVYAPEKKLEIPAPVTRQVEKLAPVVSHSAIRKPVSSGSVTRNPKAVVKPDKKKSPRHVTGRESRMVAPRAKERDFATDLRSLQDCTKLSHMRAVGTRPKNAYEVGLAAQLVPWYIRNCIQT